MRIRSLAAAGLVLVAVSATACSGGSSLGGSAASGSGSAGSAADAGQASPASNATVDVCSLLTAQQASSIVGVHYSKATSSHDMCTYTPTNAPIGMFILVFTNSGGTAAWKEELATLQEDGSAKPFTLTGAGDRAAGSAVEIGVQSGNYIIDVHGGDPNGTGSGPNAYPRSLAIAKALASKLH